MLSSTNYDVAHIQVDIPGEALYHMSFDPDGRQIALISENTSAGVLELRRYRLKDGLKTTTYSPLPFRRRAPGFNQTKMAISKDRKWVLMNDYGRLTRWDTGENQSTKVTLSEFPDTFGAVDISLGVTSPLASILGVGGRTINVWDVQTGVQRGQLSYPSQMLPGARFEFHPLGDNGSHPTVKFSPTSNLCIAANDTRCIHLWVLDRFDSDPPGPIEPHRSLQTVSGSDYIRTFVWSSDGKRIISVTSPSSATCSICCWDVSTGSVLSRWSTGVVVHSIALSSNGKFLATREKHGLVMFWDMDTHARIGRVIYDVDAIVPSPDDQYLATARVVDKLSVHANNRREAVQHTKITIWCLRDLLPDGYLTSSASQGTRLFPFAHISDEALEAWYQDRLMDAEAIISSEIVLDAHSDSSHYPLAYYALIQAQLQQWDAACDNAKKSINLHLTDIGCIARSIALCGKGQYDQAIQALDLAFCCCDVSSIGFLVLIQCIIRGWSAAYHKKISNINDLDEFTCGIDDISMCASIQKRIAVLASFYYMQDNDYEHAAQLLEYMSVLPQSPELEAIGLIFGWKRSGHLLVVYQQICNAFRQVGQQENAAKYLRNMIDECGKDIPLTTGVLHWIIDFMAQSGVVFEPMEARATHVDHSDMMASESSTMHPSSSLHLGHISREMVKDKLMKSTWQDVLSRVHEFYLYQAICEVLKEAGRILEAIDCLKILISDVATLKEIISHKEMINWLASFRQWCLRTAKELGAEAMATQRYNEAVSYFSSALILDHAPEVLLERSKARRHLQQWEDALRDVDEVILVDPMSPWGYQEKYHLLYLTGRYDNAIIAFETMLLKIEQSRDPEIQVQRRRYVTPSETEEDIHEVINQITRNLPFILIDTETGRLCDRHEQHSAFKDTPLFKKLIASVLMPGDRVRIHQVVQEFYRYAMLSHTWEGKHEPQYYDVSGKSVYGLQESPVNSKLRQFCIIARQAGLRWAWSDTCCIKKDEPRVLGETLILMFKWYNRAWRTIVILRGMQSPSKPDSIENSLWITRAWTFQEYVASPFIWFYTPEWKPYLDLGVSNHKESPLVMLEIERSTGVSSAALRALSPGVTDIREKLQLASPRETTVEEDTAYSLLGIFDIDSVPVRYGDGVAKAVGHLLEQLISKSGDEIVLDWTGKAGNHNSCLPANISVFDRTAESHIPLPIEEAQLSQMVARVRSALSEADIELAGKLYESLEDLELPLMVAGRLKLPCIRFALEKVTRVGNHGVYQAVSLGLGDVLIKTSDDLSKLDNLFLVHPWIQVLLDPAGNGTAKETTNQWWRATSLADKETAGLRLVACLRRPFGALLLHQVPLQGIRRVVYKRVATDAMIQVHIRVDCSLTHLIENIRTLDVF